MFSVEIPFVTYILMAVALCGLLMVCFYCLRPYVRAARFDNPPLPQEGERCPKVSVVVYCLSNEEVLMSALADLDRQDYPEFEVVVVCDAGVEYASYISERINALYKNVYVTFVQPGSHNLSRRKLAYTLGIKAAKGEIVVTTVANIKLPSESWLTRLVAPFCGETGRHINVSTGLSIQNFNELRGFTKWYRQFDTLLTDALWIGYAAAGQPYRGDGNNLAFRRKVFFEQNGYSKTYFLHNGDDDVFVNQIADGSNMRVVVGSESIVTTEWGESANRVWSIRKAGYDFTRRWLPRAPFFRSGLMMGLQWVVTGAAVTGAALAAPKLIPTIVALVILLLMWGAEISVYRNVAARVGAVRLWWAVPLFWLIRPVVNVLFRYDHLGLRKKNFTWQR